jgi:Flp pilus assembly protein TadB
MVAAPPARAAHTTHTHTHAHTHTENYAEHERQKETYEEQLMVARERLEEVNREANKLRKQRDVTLEAHLRKIRQLEIQKKTLQVALFSLACVSCVCRVCVVLVLTLGICE